MAIAFLPMQPVETGEFILAVDAHLIDAIERWKDINGLDVPTSQAAEMLLRQALRLDGCLEEDRMGAQRAKALLEMFQEAAGPRAD
ncbi:hypothetical protein DevBK_11160 [Devosia sp. BK]|jgi:hypothetical protein|uniref:hypothetical protein n=1 Tax=unclassified Devosia TaxID=196773 RepID=UPI0007129661|nr:MULTISPECIES: hypothetical protein [unclassified Devosia]KQN76876.1 hypothetical protein ASE94_18280 [Devosia sp. Leaf64]KQT49451.1 hypothetical protein ASG47_03735 [Devosia sp. Leaf420]MDV3251891.1 hypothetical protein [Devosia sp. BK]